LVLANGANTLTVSGAETITGGTGADIITLGAVLSGGTINLGAGTDRLILANGANTIAVSNIEVVTGGTGADAITASGSTSTRLTGGEGADTLVGGSGGDQIMGGAGVDNLTGGSGVDRFIYTAISESPTGTGDTITDFDATVDLILLSGMLTGAFTFLGASSLGVTGESQARFDNSTKVLSIDINGDGTAEMSLTLTGVAIADLDSADFIWL
ncbi:M10 family metallopeptidase C-terminal domain-containing protein, partial [Paeniroseomonas aquatica]